MRAKALPPCQVVQCASALRARSQRAGGSRSLRVPPSQSMRLRATAAWAAAAGRDFRGRRAARKMSGVGTGTPGLTSTRLKSGKCCTGAIRFADAARDQRAGGKAHRHIGAERRPDWRARLVVAAPRTRSSARTAAAASLEPPPRPEAMGTFFSRQSRPAGNRRAGNVRAKGVAGSNHQIGIRRVGTSAANGPVAEK